MINFSSTASLRCAVNFSTRKVGGIRFIKLGRFCFSFCITRSYVAMGASHAASVATRSNKPARVRRPDNAQRVLDDIEGELAALIAREY